MLQAEKHTPAHDRSVIAVTKGEGAVSGAARKSEADPSTRKAVK